MGITIPVYHYPLVKKELTGDLMNYDEQVYDVRHGGQGHVYYLYLP